MVLPPLIQPYERGNATIGFRVASGKTQNEELHIGQLARFKMPRMLYQPQQRVQEKAYRLIMREDDLDKLPALPALIGGSILDGAEVSYDRMSTALASMVGSRLLDSIDETLIGVSLTAASVDQRREYLAGLRRMFEASRDYAAELIKSGKPSFGKITHLLPMSGDKQLIEIKGGMSGNGSKQSYTIDDVMMHARLHAGALGIDLSMLGFADQLSGGFGEGGFFRVSAQAASCSANVRGALTAGFNHIANIHCLHRYGVAFDAADLPWQLTYYSGISALENERAATVLSKINSAGLLLQSMAAMRELGMDEAAMLFMLKEQFGLQEAEAKLYAQQLAKQPPAEFESETEV
jgi:predicted HTH domain antitoxin